MLKWSLIVGFVGSCVLHIASAITVAFFPYKDEPLSPRLFFVYALLPGWAIAGRAYHVKMWQESVAVAINGAVYGSIVYCFLTWKAWRRGEAHTAIAHWLVEIVLLIVLLWLVEALFHGFLP